MTGARAVPEEDLFEGSGQDPESPQPAKRPSLATNRDILGTFAGHVLESGLVGESRLTKLVFLAANTYHMDRLVSLAVKGVSSSGKSFITSQVLNYFPNEAYFALTSMSDKALVYTDEDFKNRFIVIYEASGMESDMTTYIIRSLLSEGRLRYLVTEKDAKAAKYTTRLIDKPGPTGLIVTTTATSLHPENETRLMSLTVKDTNQQTADIMVALAGEGSTPDYTEWHQLHDWLSEQDNRTDIPYATCLAVAIPPVAVRLRRDFAQVLALIRSHAVLHQATRERDEKGRIVATRADYEAVRDLVSDIVAEAVEQSVGQTTRETVAAVQRVIDQSHSLEKTVSVRELMGVLHLDRSTVQRRVQQAVHGGYLRNTETQRGRPGAYVIAQALPEDTDVIPSWETVIRPGCTGGVHVCKVSGRDTRDAPAPERSEEGETLSLSIPPFHAAHLHTPRPTPPDEENE